MSCSRESVTSSLQLSWTCGVLLPTSVRAVSELDGTAEWHHLISLDRPQSVEALFRAGSNRSTAMSITIGELLVDFSRQLVSDEILQALVDLARTRGVEAAWSRMRSGELVNSTENRAVGHIALRCHADETFMIGGCNVVADVQATLASMGEFAQGISRGTVTGSTGKKIRTVVNIGIGGSDLGPTLMFEALQSFSSTGISCRFVSNVDPSDLAHQLVGLDPSETMVIVVSKTFTTSETLANATAAQAWLSNTLGIEGSAHHLVAVSASADAVAASGVLASKFFPMWDWVGGRFSMGSAVGLAAMIALGPDIFQQFLEGQRELDLHTSTSFDATNAPLVMALIGLWNRNVLGYSTRAVIPYAYDLRNFPSYLQQLIMESNGKGVRADGEVVSYPTTPVIWGGVGTDAQHAFMQFIHQSPDVVPVDFLGFAQSSTGDHERQTMLFMNLIAQAEALAYGRHVPDAPHRSFSGSRPSTVIAAPTLTPRVLGQIVALYEHAVFFEGVILGINSFDQWGVELGKELAGALLASPPEISPGSTAEMHSESRFLLDWFQRHRGHHSSSSKRPEAVL